MTQPLWIKAVVTREGPDLVTRCCVVAGANFHPIEIRVNLPRLAALLRSRGLGPKGDKVAGFGSFLKKAARAVTHNKLTKAVGKVVGKVVNNPIVQIMNPAAAITAHTLSRATGGKGTIKGKAGMVVNLGTAAASAAAGPAALQYAAPQAAAALGIGLKTVMSAKLAGTVASVAKDAQKIVAQGKTAANLLKTGQLSRSAALPLVKRALAVRTSVQKAAPALAKKVQLSRKVQASIKTIADKARAGSPEARIAAVSIAAAAKAADKISQAQQAAGGGHPGFVITANGKIRKAPKGKFVMNRSLPVVETLYRGAKVEPMKGTFTAVNGWDGDEHRVIKETQGALAAASVMNVPIGPIVARATQTLMALERQGRITPAQTTLAFAAINRFANKLRAAPKGIVGASRAKRNHRAHVHEFYDRRTLVPSSYPALEAEVYRALVEDAYERATLPAPPGYVGGMHETGPSWGGYDDPADEYEGPLYPVTYPDEDSVSGYPVYVGGRPLPAGSRSWPRPQPGTTAAARERAAALLELARARHHAEQVLKRARTTKVGNMAYELVGSHIELGPEHGSDVPPELAAYNDGLPSELIGCAMTPNVAGFPSYLFTRKGLHPVVVRRRFLAALKAMPPKMRRRVLTRLRRATFNARVSGAVQSIQPSFGGYPAAGWSTVSGCSQVAGALTP